MYKLGITLTLGVKKVYFSDEDAAFRRHSLNLECQSDHRAALQIMR